MATRLAELAEFEYVDSENDGGYHGDVLARL
jgi:hypothetical protein